MDLTRLKAIKEQQAIKDADNKRAIESKLSTLDLQETVVKSFSMFKDYLDGKVSKAIVVNQIEDFATHQDAEKFISGLNSLHETLKTLENNDITPLTEVMKNVLKETKKLSKEKPSVDYTEQLNIVNESVKAVEKAIKAQRIALETAKAQVLDLTPIIEAIKAQKHPEVVKTEQMNTLITERFDEWRAIVYEREGYLPVTKGIQYFLDDKLVAELKFKIQDGKVIGAKKVKVK